VSGPQTRGTGAALTLWVPSVALDAMTAEADERAPNETGGVLLGYWSSARDTAVVEHVVGPGPRALHRLTEFVPDHGHQASEIARLFRRERGNLDYLGDWHTHPVGPLTLSWKDQFTLRRIAQDGAARAPQPVMLLLAGGSPWRVGAWRGELLPSPWWGNDFRLHALNVYVER
jgi:integrative and conjugative element protein (TIGR02256 family)